MVLNKLLNKCFLFLPLIILASCGGGGGGGDGTPVAPSLSFTFTSSDNNISIDESVTLTWNASTASSCTASGAWSGSKGIDGSETVTISSAGNAQFTLSCSSSSGTSASKSVTVNAGYPIAVGNIYHPSSSSSISLFLDENSNGMFDSWESTFSSDSNGAYELRSDDLVTANCLKLFPVGSDSDLTLYSSNPSKNGNFNINPMTSILSNYARHGSIYSSSQSNDCSAIDQHESNYTKGYLEGWVLPRIELYYGLNYSQLESDVVIENQRSIDLNRFQNSMHGIKDSIIEELTLLLPPSSGSSIWSNAKLDDSTFSIFLNQSSYPNPSTDPSPAASSIDAVAVQGGISIFASLPNYAGTWGSKFSLISTDLMISNNQYILSHNSTCYLNFTSLCLLDPTFNNLLSQSEYIIEDIYEKDTSRGREEFINLSYVSDAETLACSLYDRQQITLENDQKHTELLFEEYRGSSYFIPEDLACYTFDNRYSGVTIRNSYPDGTYVFSQVWDLSGSYFDNIPAVYVDNYDDEYPPPEQIQSETVDAMSLYQTYYENSAQDSGLLDGSSMFNIFLAMLNGTITGWGENIELYNYIIRPDGEAITFIANMGNYNVTCITPDYYTTVDLYQFSFDSYIEVVNTCIAQSQNDYIFDTQRTIRNKSPYRGFINE